MDLELLKEIISRIPIPIFWKDLGSNFLGCNKLFLPITGFNNCDELIGKTDTDLPCKEFAEQYYADDKYVINNLKQIKRIEHIRLPNQTIISETTKVPLFKDGNLIGILGIILDITDRIKRENLELKNQAYLIENQQQKKFKKVVERVVHDIGSPIGAITLMIPAFDAIPEQKRLTLKNSLNHIRDILDNLWDEFLPEKNHNSVNMNLTSVIVHEEILNVINEKKYEFNQYSIDFILQTSDTAYFAFINVDTKEFKRMLSNLINNAVDALGNTAFRKITLHLDIVDDKVRIVVEDNGIGMPEEVKDKIMNNIRVTSGKINGHGVGFEYIRDILTNNNGTLSIESKQNCGTKIILTFPKVTTPNWMCNKLIINPNDIIVVLDDDDFIHDIWNIKLNPILQKTPSVQLKHFKFGLDVINFIKPLPIKEKTKYYF
jgi:PAS domain S-box-containing protein